MEISQLIESPVPTAARGSLEVAHLCAGARADERLVRDDDDRRELVRRIACPLGSALLAYCVMDTHVHVMTAGPPDELARALETALAGYMRTYNRRHDLAGTRLRGPVDVRAKTDPFEIARAITYVHRNPLATARPLAARAVEYPWSSQRAFAGLDVSGAVNASLARLLCGRERWRLQGEPVPHADLEPVAIPVGSPGKIAGAIAQVVGIHPALLASGSHDPAAAAARVAYVRLGMLESYTRTQLSAPVGWTRARMGQLAGAPARVDVVRAARTILRDPALARWIVPLSG